MRTKETKIDLSIAALLMAITSVLMLTFMLMSFDGLSEGAQILGTIVTIVLTMVTVLAAYSIPNK